MNDPLSKVLAALEKHGDVRRVGKEWQARCPAHADDKPSLNVRVADDGRVLLVCRSQSCPTAAIVEALGLSLVDLFPTAATMPATAKRRREIVAHYGYRDESGALVFDVVRYDDKSFGQRQPNDDGGWTWNMQGVKRVPYRLPELLASADLGELVFVCEGEKDCDRLAKLGLVATCNNGGAGKWSYDRADLMRWFASRNAVVCPDSDDVGRKHAAQVAASLVGIASTIRIVEFDGLAEHGDVSDWLDAGNDRAALEALVDATPLWTPTQATQPADEAQSDTTHASGPRITTLREAVESVVRNLASGQSSLIGTGTPDLDYALAGGVERGEMVILAARPSHGKSAFALQMAHFWTACEMPTLIISEEMSALSLGKRALQWMSDAPTEHWKLQAEKLWRDIEAYSKDRAECFIAESVGSADAAADLIGQHVARHGVACVVVDYAQLLRSAGKNRYEQVSATSVALRQAASANNVLLVALCQLNRQVESRNSFVPTMSDIRDSGQLEQDADVVLLGVWPHRLDSRRDPFDWQVFIGKNRNRAINQHAVSCRFEPSRQRFVDAGAGKPFAITAPSDDDADDWGNATYWER